MVYTLSEPFSHELVIKKSRFLACVQPVQGRAEAQSFVLQLKATHPEAVHVCWAMMAGGQSAAQDDGEPSGTAGRPMLEVLRHQALDGVLATVVRYFGGVKLGAGGLVRAYTDSVAQCLLKANKIPLRIQTQLVCQAPYELEGMIRRHALKQGVAILEVAHGSLVQFHFQIEKVKVKQWISDLNEWGQGKLIWPEIFDEFPFAQASNHVN